MNNFWKFLFNDFQQIWTAIMAWFCLLLKSPIHLWGNWLLDFLIQIIKYFKCYTIFFMLERAHNVCEVHDLSFFLFFFTAMNCSIIYSLNNIFFTFCFYVGFQFEKNPSADFELSLNGIFGIGKKWLFIAWLKLNRRILCWLHLAVVKYDFYTSFLHCTAFSKHSFLNVTL